MRFYRGSADDPTARTLRRQAVEAQQLTLALGEEKAEGLVFRFALEASLRPASSASCSWLCVGKEGQVECSGPVALEVPSTGHIRPEPAQLRLLGEDVQVPTMF